MDVSTMRQDVGQAERQTGRETDRQRERGTDRQTHDGATQLQRRRRVCSLDSTYGRLLDIQVKAAPSSKIEL